MDVDTAIDKVFLRKNGREDLLTIVPVNTVQVIRLGFLFGDDVDAIEQAELRNMVEDLAPEMLFVLDWVEGEVEFCEQIKLLYVV